MELSEIYTGMKVKILGYEGEYEMVKIEAETKEAYCKRIDINIHDLRAYRISYLQRL